MAYEHKEGFGAVFKTQDKVPGDNRPALKGDGMFEGSKVRLAVWKKQAKNGQTFYSVHMEREQPKKPEPVAGVPEEEFNDDIPF